MARGEYVYFLDSDDMITPTALEELYVLAKEETLDGVYFDSQVLLESEDLARYAEGYLAERRGDYPETAVTGPELLERFLDFGEWMVYVQRQFWRRDFLLENRIFSPERTEHEDELFSFEAIQLARRVRYVRKNFFIHRYRENSVMTRQPHPKDFHGYFTIFCRMLEFTRAHGLSGRGVEVSTLHMCECAMRFLDVFEATEDPAKWFSPEDEERYHMFRQILQCQEFLRADEEAFWEPLTAFRKIWIYGAGRVARSVITRLRAISIRPAGVFVSSAEGNPAELLGVPVREIGTADPGEDSAVVVAMAVYMQDGPAARLREMGCTYFRYCRNVLEGPFRPETERR